MTSGLHLSFERCLEVGQGFGHFSLGLFIHSDTRVLNADLDTSFASAGQSN